MTPFWDKIAIPHGETRYWELGPLAFWVRHLPGEWQVAVRREDQNFDRSLDHRWLLGAVDDFPEDETYRRFAFDSVDGDQFLELRPEFPDRSVVSRPEIEVRIPPNSKARFYCGIPLWVRLSAGTEQALKPLTTLPVRQLSRTWFGSPEEGEACYAAITQASRDYKVLKPIGHMVLSPIRIVNRAPDPLLFERICVRVDHLRIFQGESYLWSNEIRITKQSHYEFSRVAYGNGAPKVEPEAFEVAPAREIVSKGGVLLRTFNSLRKP